MRDEEILAGLNPLVLTFNEEMDGLIASIHLRKKVHFSEMIDALKSMVREENERAKRSLDALIEKKRRDPMSVTSVKIENTKRTYRQLVFDNRSMVDKFVSDLNKALLLPD